jgi:uncharacterized phage-associated protein
MTPTASNVAKFILMRFQANRSSLINLKLQKLLYYSQAWHLAFTGEALFHDRIEAWIHGPVVPTVFGEYKQFGWSPISIADGGTLHADGELVAHVDNVLRAYGSMNAWQLERLSHSESPWREARGGLPPDAPSKNVITEESMRAFYSRMVNG